ncbi:MAG: hypothetical protein IH818_12715 [Acidobacteria bacterium]|nr:hypothetical protein [Acidobacteriota bacterium]
MTSIPGFVEAGQMGLGVLGFAVERDVGFLVEGFTSAEPASDLNDGGEFASGRGVGG